ncbi:alpha/beta fold hydrolase [Humibacillus xanthopallidus]|uniref:alpha/beta fold hydrolase n=1 Tax=Humibacillus xanthopallidus TaxID=412689 RepID=UPI00163B052E|nr:alpha/beta fold hydrolase [Humibacillus xanthopallidus]
MTKAPSVAVFVHGFISGAHTWTEVLSHLESDPQVVSEFDLKAHSYDTRLFGWRPDRRIPDIPTLGEDLKSFLEIECQEYESVVLVGHSMGGLIVQQYLAQMLWDNCGAKLNRVRRIVLLACPTNGSEFLLSFRKSVPFLRNVQEKMLRPHSITVTRAHKKVMQDVVFAKERSDGACPIPVAAYAGTSDNVVPLASAQSDFPGATAISGDHFSILAAPRATSRIVTALKYELHQAANHEVGRPDGQATNDYQLEIDPASGDRRILSTDPMQPLVRLQDRDGRISDIFDRSLARELLRGGGPDGPH